MVYYDPSSRGYQGLGQAALPTVTGAVSYAGGGLSRDAVGGMGSVSMEEIDAFTSRHPEARFHIAGPRLDPQGGPSTYALFWVKEDVRPGRPGGPDGGVGWYLFMADLIPVPGGFLGGFVLLDGAVPADLVVGQTYTFRGTWTGTPPNNLCGNCGWHFSVAAEAAPEDQGDTGAITPEEDPEAMVEARFEALAETEPPEVVEAARAMHEADYSPESVRDYYEAKGEEPPPRYAATPEEEPPPGEEGPPVEGPPVLAAGIPTGTLAAIIVGALFFLPMLTKDRKKRG